MSSRKLKIAAIQAAPVSFDLPATIERVAKLTAEAASQGANLVVFPEAFVSAYPWQYAFDSTIGWRRPRGRKWFAKYHASSVAIPSPEFDQLGQIARDNDVLLHVGIIEKEGSTLYCTMVIWGRDGKMLSKHRKLMPTAIERLVWGFGGGDGLKVVDTELGKVGGLICWENYMPAARMALYQQHIDIYLAPNADDLPAWTASMQHIAKEGRCFVVSVNQFLQVKDFPSDYPPFLPGETKDDGQAWSPEDIVSRGGSFIAGPLGTCVTEPVWDKEAIIMAEIDMAELWEARMDHDATGHYSRPDVFQLSVNTSPLQAVTFNPSAPQAPETA